MDMFHVHKHNRPSEFGVENQRCRCTESNINQNIKNEFKPEKVVDILGVESNTCTCTHICFLIFYYFFFVPFKILRNDATKSYYAISTSLIHQMICAIVHIMAFINYMLEIRGLFTSKVRENPKLFFSIGERVNIVIYFLAFINLLWFKKDAVVRLFSSTCKLESKSKIDPFKAKFFATLFWTTWIIWSAMCFLSKYLQDDLGGICFNFMQQICFELKFKPCSQDEHLAIQLLAPIFFLSRIHKWVLIDCSSALHLILAFVCLRMSKSFKNSLELNEISEGFTNASDEEIFLQYANLKEYFQKFNDALSIFHAISFVSLITSIPTLMIAMMDSNFWSDRLLIGFYISIFVIMYFMFAETHRQASYYKTWLSKRQMSSVRDIGNYLAVADENVGIAAGCFSTITYGMIGTAGSIIMTYTIIYLQFN